jgi:small subunit ribosomal protein S6
MRHYELMVILDPELEERTVAPSLDKFLNVIRKGGGTVEKVDIWGRRRLAYEIKKKAEGIYAVIDMTTQPADAKELDRQLNLNEAVLRTKLMRPEPTNARTKAAIAARAARAAASAANRPPAPAGPPAPASVAPAAPVAEAAPAAEAEAEPAPAAE